MKKVSIRSLLTLFVLILIFSTPASAAKVKLNKKSLTLTVGKTYKLKVKGTKKKVKWSSNNKTVASVNKKGKVTAKKAGNATITAKIGKKKYKCKVTVNKKQAPVKKAQFNKSAAISSISYLEKYFFDGCLWQKITYNYSLPASLTFDYVFYKNGAVVEKETYELFAVNSGSTKWIFFYIGDTDYDNYSINVKAEEAWDYDISKYITITASNTTKESIYLTIVNNSNQVILGPSYILVFFYNNGTLVGIEPVYMHLIYPKTTEILEGSLPYNSKAYKYINFTSYSYHIQAFGVNPNDLI